MKHNRIKAALAAGILALNMTACGTQNVQSNDLTASLSPHRMTISTKNNGNIQKMES